MLKKEAIKESQSSSPNDSLKKLPAKLLPLPRYKHPSVVDLPPSLLAS